MGISQDPGPDGFLLPLSETAFGRALLSNCIAEPHLATLMALRSRKLRKHPLCKENVRLFYRAAIMGAWNSEKRPRGPITLLSGLASAIRGTGMTEEESDWPATD